jgi:hypothetical protein
MEKKIWNFLIAKRKRADCIWNVLLILLRTIELDEDDGEEKERRKNIQLFCALLLRRRIPLLISIHTLNYLRCGKIYIFSITHNHHHHNIFICEKEMQKRRRKNMQSPLFFRHNERTGNCNCWLQIVAGKLKIGCRLVRPLYAAAGTSW